MIQINDLDLSLLQFDFELTWAAFFLNGDRTLYGRYGTRSYRDRKRNVFFDRVTENKLRDGLPEDMSIEGFKASMRMALEVHADAAKDPEQTLDSLRKKRGEDWPWPTPADMPGIQRGCTHCHQVNSNLVLHHRKTPGTLHDRLLWSFPMPDLLGIHVDPRSAATITHVDEGSEAAQAGLRDGDVVTYMAGQRILSPADIQWALHVAPDEVDIEVRVRRTNDEFATKVSLPPNWRRRGSFSWRWRSNRETLKRMLDGEAWHCEDLAENERTRVGIPRGQLGIKVLGNLRKKDKVLFAGDIITAVDDRDTLDNCSEFFAYIMQDKLPGSTLRLSVLRDGQPLRFELPVVE